MCTIYLCLYVELSPGLSQQSHHIHFAFLSCQVKSSPAIDPVHINTVSSTSGAIYSNTVCDGVMCSVSVVGAAIIPCPVC